MQVCIKEEVTYLEKIQRGSEVRVNHDRAPLVKSLLSGPIAAAWWCKEPEL